LDFVGKALIGAIDAEVPTICFRRERQGLQVARKRELGRSCILFDRSFRKNFGCLFFVFGLFALSRCFWGIVSPLFHNAFGVLCYLNYELGYLT